MVRALRHKMAHLLTQTVQESPVFPYSFCRGISAVTEERGSLKPSVAADGCQLFGCAVVWGCGLHERKGLQQLIMLFGLCVGRRVEEMEK